jgi:choline dehydrogenase
MEMRQLLDRDINRLDSDRYAPSLFVLPDAINPTTGRRSSIAEYINSVIAAGHPLSISLHSLASRILFENSEGNEPTAVGVEYMVGRGLYSVDQRYNRLQTGEIKTVRAKKEVIVSGGTFNTPQILKLSGIGPREELEAHDIPVIVELPAVVCLISRTIS